MGNMFKPVPDQSIARLLAAPQGPISGSDNGLDATHNRLSTNHLDGSAEIISDLFQGHPMSGNIGTNVAMLLPELLDRGELDGEN